ncbi:MAG: 2-oxoglutarate dehydrogenase E2 component (dihydrolipoamide succinyltransferase) [Patiriisocius sp.]|jgi:2-oxoglutarate dehydrogenase E2 component (dihydrolipoamide succinyltransferase)
MAQIELILPKMGESVAEATITNWLKKVGDSVEEDESVLEIATDKVDSEVPSPETGIITELLFEEGDVVQVGQTIAVISTEGEGPVAASVPQTQKVESAAVSSFQEPVALTAEFSSNGSNGAISKKGKSGRFYSPLVRKIAQEEKISMVELEALSGSGAEGRVTKKDILAYIPNKGNQVATSVPAAKVAPVVSAPVATKATKAISVSGGDEIIEMDRMRKLIADHMVMSKQTSPHVTSYVEADVTNIVTWRNKNKNTFLEREGEKLTFTPIFIEAIVKAIKDFPMINISVDGDKIIKRKNINIGMATALPSGNLIVPVIKNADNLNLTGIAKNVNSLANKARNNKLAPDDIQGGTYTVTNVGSFGNVMGTPIINQPQVAIMAVGAIRKKPAVIETPEGDFIGIRHMMFLSHAYDHRVVDGALGGSFVRRVADYLENFDPDREL